ncbi:hypothetical protein IFM89_029971 [Coptis chinensis]|uniref:Uncharacterized protein n=1 Tax=Coptis chinensis TaxID=261450 RepID=A0A835M2E2_9MAGN|nr:hypothetical protein IFM89_029971 [Coptis chinensis]
MMTFRTCIATHPCSPTQIVFSSWYMTDFLPPEPVNANKTSPLLSLIVPPIPVLSDSGPSVLSLTKFSRGLDHMLCLGIKSLKITCSPSLSSNSLACPQIHYQRKYSLQSVARLLRSRFCYLSTSKWENLKDPKLTEATDFSFSGYTYQETHPTC